MNIIATCSQLGKKSVLSREFVRKAMVEHWKWSQSKADAHLVMLEMGKTVTIESPKGILTLELQA